MLNTQIEQNSTKKSIYRFKQLTPMYENIYSCIIYTIDDSKRPLYISLDKYGFWYISYSIKYKESADTTIKFNYGSRVSLYSFHKLENMIVEALYIHWISKKLKQSFQVRNKIIKWAKKNTLRALDHRFYIMWQEGINELLKINPTCVELHKKLFATSPSKGCYDNLIPILQKNNSFDIHDLLNYKAARIALLFNTTINSNHVISNNFYEEWQTTFSSTKKLYPTLNRTLMNLPGNIPPSLCFEEFNKIILPETVTTRLKLIAYLLLPRKYNSYMVENNIFRTNYVVNDFEYNVLLRSTEKDIKDAIQYTWRYFPPKGLNDFRNTRAIIDALRMIFDYEGSWENIDILGLAKRSVEFHRNEELMRRIQEENMRREMERRKEEFENIKKSNTKLPKIDLPNNEHIIFLDTFKRVQEEGEMMQHCIASYAEKAVAGECYLFHVDYEGEMASVEVLPSGIVSQSFGPHDSFNKASDYGRKVLSLWAKDLIKVGENT